MKKRYRTETVEVPLDRIKEVLAGRDEKGWRVVEASPIEEITVKIVGRRFVFERPIDGEV